MATLSTMRDVKKHLAATYPDVSFAYDTAGRGCDRGPLIQWTGGPSASDVLSAAKTIHRGHRAAPLHVRRQMDPAEQAAAAEKIARRKAGKQAAAATRAANASVSRRLLEAFPGASYTVSDGGQVVSWIDGPDVADVRALLGLDQWSCRCCRTVTAERRAADEAAAAALIQTRRLAKRLAQSKVRALRIEKGQRRRERLECNLQYWLPFALAA